MSMSNLPSELVEEIVSRVPLKSMRAVRLTCKKWNTLSKNQARYTSEKRQEHAATREGESQMIVLKDYNVYLMSVISNGIDTDPSTECKGKLTCLNEQVQIYKVFHCEGVLLLVLKDDMLVVWNPYSGQTRLIVPRYSCHGQERSSYALGYVNKKNQTCRSHKILRYSDVSNKLWCEIYDFDSGLWTTFAVTPQSRSLAPYNLGLSLKGNTYGHTKISRINHIVCFDYTSESFGPLLHLPLEEKLAVLHHLYHSTQIEIWVTTKIEAKIVSWSMFLTVDKGPFGSIPAYWSFFIDEEKKVAVVSNSYSVGIIGEAGYSVGEIDIGEPADKNYWGHVCSYVPSLVQIKEPLKGLKQKNLKKRL
ncbi:hypothetical protein EUTSA_v10000467mg [Eutrema salsugineum]|uniref:F-box domain-containing protein n=1 Tax=Eutrema salsugineum TaxID=72664 RepID=V4NJS9_EUTSA|nr:hypothetical protein EUTSA_v10000467mg [Eutrema salsugineum]